MLKKLRKRVAQQNVKTLSAVISTVLVIALPALAFAADVGQVKVSSGTITLTDNISTTADDDAGYGLWALNPGTKVTMNGGSIKTKGYFANGVQAGDGGKVTLNNVGITPQDGWGVNAQGGEIIINGGSVMTNNIAARASCGGSVTLNNNVSISSNNTALLAIATKYGSGPIIGGTVIANLTGGSIFAPTLLEACPYSTVTITASNNSRLFGTAVIIGDSGYYGTANLTLNSGSAWITPGDSFLTNLTLHSGNVLIPLTPGSTLTVNNLAGNGTFYLNSNPSAGTSGLISVTDSASGNYQLIMNNLSGTSGIIKVVDIVNGATNTATFTASPQDIGIYRYGVEQGSKLSQYYSGLDNSDYYYGNFAPSTPVRSAMSTGTSVNSFWYGEMNDIKKRMGELRMGYQKDSDIWARTYATKYRLSPSGGYDYKQHVNGVEIGKDRPEEFSDGKRFTGVVLGAGHASNSFDEGGSGKSDSFYLGAYKSWIKNDGAYFDIIGKYNWFKHEFDSPVLGGGSDSASYHTNGCGLSAEMGKRFEKKDGYFIEPQLEVSSFWSGRANYTTDIGLNVETDRGRSLQLRVGSVFGKETNLSDGAKQQIYGKVSWVREFEGDNNLQVNGASFDTSLKGNQLVAGFGIVTDTSGHQIYVDVEKSWGKTTSKDWGIDLGCRWKF